MTAVLVDSNVLLDVATTDPTWSAWSTDALERAANDAVLVINPLIYAEVSIGFDRIEDLEDALPRDTFRRDSLPYEAAFLAGKCFVDYRRRAAAVSPASVVSPRRKRISSCSGVALESPQRSCGVVPISCAA
ncbi:MAG TPA: hypothetical protein VNB06_18020 [Thermoanaerobaculia bacterium]|nr:hypothetical protein [Thermoanaerobaculia bacterium]